MPKLGSGRYAGKSASNSLGGGIQPKSMPQTNAEDLRLKQLQRGARALGVKLPCQVVASASVQSMSLFQDNRPRSFGFEVRRKKTYSIPA